MSEVITIEVAAVVFREDLYPRIETSATTVQKYAEDLSVLPPIEVNQHNELIDGWHRWQAHQKKEAATIRAVITHTADDGEVLEFAIMRNSKFGLSLSRADKQRMARRIYREASAERRGEKKRRLAELLSMSYDTIDRWLSRIDKDDKEERDAAVQSLYLQCYTQEEIAEAVGMPLGSVDGKILEIRKYGIPGIPGLYTEDMPEDGATEKIWKAWEQARADRILAENVSNAGHSTDFDVPIYNVWKQQNKSEGSSHFGNSETRWVDNLLHLYTRPFDVVIDPFAGGGSTLDLCRKRFRRCWISDRKPIVERERDIRQHDLTEGLPKPPGWKDVKLVYLDPPYWWQAKGEYSEDATDLANMELKQFSDTLAGIIKDFAKKLSDAYIALIISPTQWNAPDRAFTDHVGDMLRAIKLPVDMRFSVPYESQQANAQMVEWAKANKRCLVLTREIVVWKV